MRVLKLIARNATRHMLRTSLTVLGVAIAVTAFCVIRSAIGAWYLNSSSASPNRLICRNAISLAFTLPIAYRQKILDVPGVKDASASSWFGGIYVDQSNFFPKFAVEQDNYFKMYPEYIIPHDQFEAFLKERNAVIVGRRLADRFGFKVGDAVRIAGDIYPGNWDFVIRGIYTGAHDNTNESSWFMHYDYVDERMRQETPGRAGQVGSFAIQIDDPSRASAISQQIDELFKNSLAETKTETEESFRLGFVSMSEQIIVGLQIISFLVIGVILLVLANTMAMAARERVNEYALLKTLGFSRRHLIGLVFGESIFIAMLGGAFGIGLASLVIPLVGKGVGGFLPKVPFSFWTVMMALAAALVVGMAAAIFPTARAVRTPIVEGLRPID